MDIYQNMDSAVEYKDDHSPLTAADIIANKMIVDKLREHFPSYAILSEEEKDDRIQTKTIRTLRR